MTEAKYNRSIIASEWENGFADLGKAFNARSPRGDTQSYEVSVPAAHFPVTPMKFKM